MKYEIGNPSDACFVDAEDPKAATAGILLIGHGQYFTKAEDGKRYPSFYAIGNADPQVDWKETFGITLNDYLAGNGLADVIACLKTFRYASERSSLNNIGAAAEAWVSRLEKLKDERQAAAKADPATNLQQPQNASPEGPASC